ncbi:dszB domain protein [Burkholderia gladioli]|uniref:DszB domain protein n=1 Tax=Burkholderia gladioli TaxID=28095 RepID=A0AAW3FBL1_BURGA|nr:dszB domain protein [Burkholderia gladioli]
MRFVSGRSGCIAPRGTPTTAASRIRIERALVLADRQPIPLACERVERQADRAPRARRVKRRPVDLEPGNP